MLLLHSTLLLGCCLNQQRRGSRRSGGRKVGSTTASYGLERRAATAVRLLPGQYSMPIRRACRVQSSSNPETDVAATTEQIDRDIFALAVPLLATLAADPLLSAVDAAFVGRLGDQPLAALAVASSIFTFIVFLFQFLSSATGPLVAQSLARGDSAAASRTIGQAITFAAALGAAAAVVLSAGADPIAAAMAGSSPASPPNTPLLADAAAYLRLRAWGVPAALVTLAAGGAFRGQLDARTPLAVALGENAINAALAAALIFGVPGLGVPAIGLRGSAAACVAAEYAGAAASLFFLFAPRAGGAPALAPTLALPSAAEVAPLLSASGAVFARSVLLQSCFLLATSLVAASSSARGASGAADLAAHHISFSSWLLCAFVADSLAEAGQSLVATAFGRPDAARGRAQARAIAERTLTLGAGLGAALLAAFASAQAAGGVAALFTDSEAVRRSAEQPMLYVAAMQPLNVLVFIGDGVAYGTCDFAFVAGLMAAAGGAAAAVMVGSGGTLVGVWQGLTLLQVSRGAGLGLRFWWAPAKGPLIDATSSDSRLPPPTPLEGSNDDSPRL